MFFYTFSAPSDTPPGRWRREGQGGLSYHREGGNNNRELQTLVSHSSQCDHQSMYPYLLCCHSAAE